MALPKVRPISIREAALDALRAALLDRRFAPGQSLSEPTLAEEMNVSRGPIREALLVLTNEGLVEHSQNYGFSVVQFTETDQQEILQLRLPLETLALRLAGTRATASDVRRLADLARQLADSYADQRPAEACQRDFAFHRTIWELSGNSRLLTSLRTLMLPYFAYGTLFSSVRPDLTPEMLFEEHMVFVSFLDGTSKRDAEECVRLHLGVDASY